MELFLETSRRENHQTMRRHRGLAKASGCLGAMGVLAVACQLPFAASAFGQTSEDTAATQTREEPDELVQRLHNALEQFESSMDADARQERIEQVTRDVEALATVAPEHPWLTYFRGRTHALMGRHSDAGDELLHFIVSPEGQNDWRAYRTLGNLFVERFPRLAKGHYQKAAVLNPGAPSILYGLSVCHLKFGEVDEALRLVQEAVAADTQQTVHYSAHLANTLRADGKWDEAVTEAVRALNLAQDKARQHSGKEAYLRAVDVQYRLLIDILETRLAKPDQRSTADYLALARFGRERAELARKLAAFEALGVLERALEEASSSPAVDLLREYAIVLAEVGRTAEAIEQFEKVLVQLPDDAEAARWLTRLNQGAAPNSDTP